MTIDRRSVLELGLIGAAATSFPLAVAEIAAAQSSSKTYVLVHGAWHGGWCWKEVAEGLRGKGAYDLTCQVVAHWWGHQRFYDISAHLSNAGVQPGAQ